MVNQGCMGILCLLNMGEPSLDKLEIMRVEKVLARQVQIRGFFFPHVPLPRKFDFVAAGWQRPMLMLTMLRQLYSKLLLQGTRQAPCAIALHDILMSSQQSRSPCLLWAR
jgi:hypothetical protein